ncbi:ssDNA-binding transcriptional regulator [Microthyrium microscopicum]|uniref:SsDNA-binding transcriptional regulator n=1 Tax=Microthyrium microscopicum TaxID=703497 RepID=A0A6A6TY34_9PEZI|nr:ssDNA-binding transcriptional regulator [Microthyrium microscopicum]
MPRAKRAHEDDSYETSKKVKSVANIVSIAVPKQKKNDDGNAYWELSAKRRVTVDEFKGKTLVALREFYEKDGKLLPGKSGLSMTPEQFGVLVAAVDQIKAVLKDKGIDFEEGIGDPEEDEDAEEEADAKFVVDDEDDE